MPARPKPATPDRLALRGEPVNPLVAGATELLERGNSASALVNRIGREIVGGVFAAGQPLPTEAAMRERYGISRTALREAYSKLTAKGLIQARPRVGTSVRGREHWNMLDPDVLNWHLQTVPAEEIAAELYAVRRMVEPAAAELAARVHDPEDLDRIDRAFAEMQRNATEEAALVEADFAFHVAILRATHNGFISAFSAMIRAAMLATFELSWRGAEVIKDRRLQQHGDVARAIRAGDGAAARAGMEALLDESIEDVRGALRRRAPSPAR